VSQTRLLNRKQVKEFALETAKSRAHKFTRVGSEFYVTCEAYLKTYIRSHIQRHPSKGKTIK
jgi:hypothetical protein